VAAPELSSQGGRARSHGTRGSAGAHLDREARSGAEERTAAPKLNSARRRGPGPRATWQHQSSPQQGGEVRAAGHVAAPNLTSAGRCQLKLQLTWQRVDARPAPYLDLELVCGGIRSSGCRQRPSGPPQERLRTCRWGQFFGTSLGYLDLFTRQSTASPQEVPELKFRERPPLMRKHRRQASGGARAEGTGATTINVKTSTEGPREVLELKVRERPPSM
jgi:hypothetical protein